MPCAEESTWVNQALSHSSVRSAIRTARLDVGVTGPWLRSARGMAMSGRRVSTAWWYSSVDRTWKPVEVKIDTAELVFPMGAGTAGMRRAPRIATTDGGMAVKAWRGRECRAVVGVS